MSKDPHGEPIEHEPPTVSTPATGGRPGARGPGPAVNAVERVSLRLVPWLLRHRRPVLWTALALTLVCSVYAVRLYADLRSGIEELLPESAPSVIAARTLGGKLRSFSRLSIVLQGEPAQAEAIAQFADALAPKLRALPQSLVASVDYQTGEQDRFVREFGGLYLPTARLQALRDQLKARLAWEQRARNPLLVPLDDEADGTSAPPPVEPPPEAAAGPRFRDGRWQTPDGRLLVIQVNPPDSSTDAGRNGRLLSAAQALVAAQLAAPGAPRLRVGYSGEVAELVEEQAALVADLAGSTVVVLLFVVGALWLYFRRWAVLAAIFGALAAGCAACFAASWFLVGHLNANTAFLGSIVVGNGINAAIIVAARYLEERRMHAALQPLEESLRRAWARTLPATFVASFGAALAYLSLAATDFRGFSQFGVIGAVGMSLCWLATCLLLPPLLAALEAWRPIPLRPQPDPDARFSPFARLGALVERRPRALVLAAALALCGSALAVVRHTGPVLEVDPSRMRAKASITSGAQFWSDRSDEVFHAYLNPVVLRGETPADLQRVLTALQRRRALLGAADPLGEVRSLVTLVPPEAEQAPKLALLAELRELLSGDLLAHLSPELRARAVALRPPATLHPVRFADLPLPLQRGLTERDGTVGTVALAYPRKVERLDLVEAEALKDLIRGALAEAGGRAQAVNPLFLLSDIDEAIWRDGPRATGIALALVCILVVIVVRRLAPGAAVIGSLLLGLAGLIGLGAAAGVRVNFLNFVVLPITFGIGVDYAINIVTRYREEGPGSAARVVRETGAAVALCSATTIIGYGSLLVADNQALAGFGLLAALGEVTCLSAALIGLPAFLVLRERSRAALAPGLEGSAA